MNPQYGNQPPISPELQPYADALWALGYSSTAGLLDAAARLARTPALLSDIRSYLSSGRPAADYEAQTPSVLFRPLPGGYTVAGLIRDFDLTPCGAFLMASSLLADPARANIVLDQMIAEGTWRMLPDGSLAHAYAPVSARYPACPSCGLRWTRNYSVCPRCGYGPAEAQIDQDLEIADLLRQATGGAPTEAQVGIPDVEHENSLPAVAPYVFFPPNNYAAPSTVASPRADEAVSAPGRKHRARTLLLSGLSMLCGVCSMLGGAGFLSSSPAPQTQTSTHPPVSSAAQSGWQAFQDDFSSSSTGWPQVDNASRMLGYSEGSMYGIALKTPGSDADILIPHGFPLPLNETDLQFKARPVQGKGYIGVLCDLKDGNNLVFVAVRDGTYSMGRFVNGQATSFLDATWVNDPRIKAVNGEFQILMHCGDTVQLMVNGYSLPAVQNPNRSKGNIAVLAHSDKDATLDPVFYYQVLIDDLELRAR